MRRSPYSFGAGCAASALAIAAFAAAQAPPEGAVPRLNRIDEGVADRDALSASFREPRVDFAVPTGFRGVFEIEGHEETLVRRSGAIYGFFSRSIYSRTKQGLAANTPAGIVYSIGFPQQFMVRNEEPAADLRSSEERLELANDVRDRAGMNGRLEQRIDLMVCDADLDKPIARVSRMPEPSAEPVEHLPRFVSDPIYRRARLDALLRERR